MLVNYTVKHIQRAKAKQNNVCFKAHFGASPAVVAQIWEEFQTTPFDELRVSSDDLDLDGFLMALHHLKKYPTDLEREPIFDIDGMQGRNKVWFWVQKIQQLKKVKIVWPADNFGSDLWAITVDGVHFNMVPRH